MSGSRRNRHRDLLLDAGALVFPRWSDSNIRLIQWKPCDSDVSSFGNYFFIARPPSPISTNARRRDDLILLNVVQEGELDSISSKISGEGEFVGGFVVNIVPHIQPHPDLTQGIVFGSTDSEMRSAFLAGWITYPTHGCLLEERRGR